MLLVFYFLKLMPYVLTISCNGKVVGPEIVLSTFQSQSGVCQQTVLCSTKCERKGTFRTLLLHDAHTVIKGSLDTPERPHLGTRKHQSAQQYLSVMPTSNPSPHNLCIWFSLQTNTVQQSVPLLPRSLSPASMCVHAVPPTPQFPRHHSLQLFLLLPLWDLLTRELLMWSLPTSWAWAS